MKPNWKDAPEWANYLAQDIIDAMIMAHTGENMEHKKKHETKENDK